MPRLIRGDKLPSHLVAEVKRAFVHRNTVEHPYKPAGGDGKQTDDEYIRTHAFFCVNNLSRLAANHHACVPAGIFSAEEK
jgi:hypothetical protein